MHAKSQKKEKFLINRFQYPNASIYPDLSLDLIVIFWNQNPLPQISELAQEQWSAHSG